MMRESRIATDCLLLSGNDSCEVQNKNSSSCLDWKDLNRRDGRNVCIVNAAATVWSRKNGLTTESDKTRTELIENAHESLVHGKEREATGTKSVVQIQLVEKSHRPVHIRWCIACQQVKHYLFVIMSLCEKILEYSYEISFWYGIKPRLIMPKCIVYRAGDEIKYRSLQVLVTCRRHHLITETPMRRSKLFKNFVLDFCNDFKYFW